MSIVAEPAWETLLKKLLTERGTAMFLGRSDSGKSTLVKYLVRRLVEAGTPVALVDADIGQSALGLPGTVSRKTFLSPADTETFHFAHLSFVGSVNPAHIIPLLVSETRRMANQAREEAAITLIDTTGLVDGSIGMALKFAKLQAVAPELLVAVAAHQELEQILSQTDIPAIIRLSPSPLVKRRSPAVRNRYRHARLCAYFLGSREYFLATPQVQCFFRGSQTNLRFHRVAPGTVIGLNRHEETRALGVVTEADADSLTFMTPIASLHGINRVILGDFSFT